MKKQKPRNHPRDIQPERSWYYVNRGSIDLVTCSPLGNFNTTRLSRKVLLAMLAELKPLPKR